jgi:hypothetical protein
LITPMRAAAYIEQHPAPGFTANGFEGRIRIVLTNPLIFGASVKPKFQV